MGLQTFPSFRNVGANNFYEPQPRQSQATVFRSPLKGSSSLRQLPVNSPTIPVKNSNYDIPAHVQSENLYNDPKELN